MDEPLTVLYNCSNCPAYCCSYTRIQVKVRDVRRLAKFFAIPEKDVLRRYTKKGHTAREVVLRHKTDEHYGSVCTFLDRETRRCTVYEARPGICREFPGTGRCGYYDFLMFERRMQEDPEYVAVTNHPMRV